MITNILQTSTLFFFISMIGMSMFSGTGKTGERLTAFMVFVFALSIIGFLAAILLAIWRD